MTFKEILVMKIYLQKSPLYYLKYYWYRLVIVFLTFSFVFSKDNLVGYIIAH